MDRALRVGVSEHSVDELTCVWAAENEAMVVVHTDDVKLTIGPLLKNLDPSQPWRNSMQLCLHSPTDEDRVKIFLSHQPSSKRNHLSNSCRANVLKHLMKARKM